MFSVIRTLRGLHLIRRDTVLYVAVAACGALAAWFAQPAEGHHWGYDPQDRFAHLGSIHEGATREQFCAASTNTATMSHATARDYVNRTLLVEHQTGLR